MANKDKIKKVKVSGHGTTIYSKKIKPAGKNFPKPKVK